jgi:hypothetical protein
MHPLNARVEILPPTPQVHRLAGDRLFRGHGAQSLGGHGADLEREPVGVVEYHGVIGRPGKLAKEILPIGLVAQDEIRVIPQPIGVIPKDIDSPQKRTPAEPPFPRIFPLERVAKRDHDVSGPEPARPGIEVGYAQRPIAVVCDLKPAFQDGSPVHFRVHL